MAARIPRKSNLDGRQSQARGVEPTEAQESIAFATWLRNRRLLFMHVPNEGPGRSLAQGALLKKMGLSKGAPDFLVFDSPDIGAYSAIRGVAIEMKRRSGGSVSPEQSRWLCMLRDRGWEALVCRGASEAIAVMRNLGF